MLTMPGRQTGRPGPPPRAATGHAPLALLGLIVLLLLFPPALGALPTPAVQAAILVVFTIASWAFGLFVEPVVSLTFFLLAIVFQLAKPMVVFSGFQSTAWWLVLGGSVTGIAIDVTGLGRRLAGLLFGRATASYGRIVAAVAATSVGLAFVMPSTAARILLLMPIVLALADRLGLAPGRPGRTGLVMTVVAASNMPPTAILPANIPNAVLLGAADTLYGIKLTYGPYLLLHFPVLGVLKTVLLVGLVCRLFPEPGRLGGGGGAPAPAPLSRDELALVLILGGALLLFATDFLHGVSPAWISLGAGLICLLPAVGLVTPKRFAERANLTVLIYVAGFLGVGALIADSGLGERLSRALLQLADLTPGDMTVNLAKLTAIGAGLGFLTTLSGYPAVATPLAQDFASASGIPLYTVLMLQVVVFSTVFLPYQSPPMMIGMQLGGASLRDGARLCLPLAAATVLILIPLDYVWWWVLGYIG
jgi:di/tricarboxylate transporter